MKKIMFVCTGNTCRSAMAEQLFKKMLKEEGMNDVKVCSCGLNVTETAMSDNAKKALHNLGVVVRRFKPKQFDESLAKKQNAVICMTRAHKEKILNVANIYTIAELTGLQDIPDPYGAPQEVYDAVLGVIAKSLKIIINLLKE